MKRVLSIMVLSVLCAAAFAQPLLVGHRGCRKVSGVDENTVASLAYAQNVPVALAMLHRYVDDGAAELLAIGINKEGACAAEFVDLMAGDFTPDGRPEYNVRIDIPSARTIFESWPGKVVTSPFELGNIVRYPATVIQNGFTKAPHPLVEAYKAYKPMPYNRQMWDPTAVMFAVEGASGFTVSGPGRISVDENGSTHFEPSADGDRFYLSVHGTQAEQMARHIVELTADKTEKID